MSQPRPGPCRDFAAGNCRYGNRCRYSHDRGGSNASSRGGNTRGSPSTPTRGRSRGRGHPQASPSPRQPRPKGIPHNVCDFYWQSGACARGFECQFRHEKGTGAAKMGVQDGADGERAAVDGNDDAPLDFFSPEGLAVGAGSVHEQEHKLNPSEVHNYLHEYLRDHYVFSSVTKVQAFVRILASVNDRNKSWNTDSAQEFLQFVVTGNTLHRIGDVLRFPQVGSSVGYPAGTRLSFQRGYFPLFQFFASDLVLKSTLHQNINSLYSLIVNNHDAIFGTLRQCISEMIDVYSWKDQSPGLPASQQTSLDGLTVFRVLSTVLLQYFQRFRVSIRDHDNTPSFVQDFARWFDIWAKDVSSPQPRYTDPIASADSRTRNLTIDHIQEDILRLGAIVERESGVVIKLQIGPPASSMTAAQKSQARIAQLAQTYDPPGELRPDGPRHDNDHQFIRDISIAPTHDEIFAPIGPYLPVFSRDAPHHLPANSMERHLDIQFRLLREELISTTRASLTVIHEDLDRIWDLNRDRRYKTQLEKLLTSKGGAYRTSGHDSVYFQVYTGVEFVQQPPEAQRRGIVVTISLDTPPAGAARDKNASKRFEFWDRSRRLQGATLVALVTTRRGEARVHLGVVASYGRDIAESARRSAERIQVKVTFFEADVEMMALRGEQLCAEGGKLSKFAVLVDTGVMFDAVRPFLEKLKTTEPTEIPFGRYIATGTGLHGVEVHSPKYALAPAFKFRLQCVAKEGATISDLDVNIPEAVERARDQLKRLSVLDPSQAEAVVDTLVKEISLIQGPPGTGKSYTAKEIIRILVASQIRPIVLIAFTNHALDHMVESVLDGKITDKVIRLGTRSSNERIAEYTLDKMERMVNAPTLDRSIKKQYRVMKELEERMTETMTEIRLPRLQWHKIEEYLDIKYPDHVEWLRTPPAWISDLYALHSADEAEGGEWETAKGKNAKKTATTDDAVAHTLYGFWRSSGDIAFLSQPPPPATKQSKKGKGRADDPVQDIPLLQNPPAFFASLGFPTLPPIPSMNRGIDALEETGNVWSMSQQERLALTQKWERDIRLMAYRTKNDMYKRVKAEYEAACKQYEQMRDEVRRRILSQTDLIACTTTGAATLTSLLESISPRVLMVEEAGQVLEAHILASLVSSVHHLICIGDPQQLRPNLANYTLSMDSRQGKELYKFDRSLMERLHDEQYPMSQINVQRRMRPAISHFIREILYPKLEDNEIVHGYPHVQGMQKDVFFFNHLNKENGTEDSVSKYNSFEVEMIRELVLYFLRQGCYNAEGDIAVLCAYLGQLQKVRAALAGLKITVALDERDQDQLVRQGIDEEQAEFEEVLVAKHLRLGTVDIFQGREAKIVIVSLVRNSGKSDSSTASIGFLKSVNRINVALSRAKHGLYVLGNAANLRQNDTWDTILAEMEENDQIGSAFPIICPRHPEEVNFISQPAELPRVAPVGGCLRPCGAQMLCGHVCPSVCHAVIDNHRTVFCEAPCTRTPCPRSHPCPKRCSDNCGDCIFPMHRVALPCGHVAASVPCHKLEDLASVRCTAQVRKKLPSCEHSAVMQCSQDAATYRCQERCNRELPCCSRTCKSSCHECTAITVEITRQASGQVDRTEHESHPCERMLYCQHQCGLACAKDHRCNTSCKGQCRQQCSHQKCSKPCSVPCAPCMQRCEWACKHAECPVTCGAICSRLPCDEPCSTTLQCGHPCPSVCGEPCTAQTCVECLSDEDRQDVDIVDYLMQRKLEEIDLTSTDVAERLITLACGHMFTVETLDGHCNMHAFYNVDPMTGKFLSTKAPPIDYQTPPTCPRCRGPITALRYGRVTKRATLDIIEQNVASTMSHSLDKCTPALAALTSSLPTLKEEATRLKIDATDPEEEDNKKDTQRKGADHFANLAGMLPLSVLQTGGMMSFHGLSKKEARTWHDHISPALIMYASIVGIASTRGAHVMAYEAARSTLFRLTMEELTQVSLDAPGALGDDDTPEEIALATVDRAIGQPPPKADVRFQVEASFLTLEVRALIAEIAQARVEGLNVNPTTADAGAAAHREKWERFVAFVYDTCAADAGKTYKLAADSRASRQAARAMVHQTRFKFERMRWDVMCERTARKRAQAFDREQRQVLAKKAKEMKAHVHRIGADIERTYLKERGVRFRSSDAAEAQWLDDNVWKKINAWKGECDALEAFLAKDGVYEPLSTQEMEDIVRSFNFSHRGHFYNCENGHTFVITECGGAQERSRCPECAAPIGGGNHQIDNSNTRAKEFEAAARRIGVRAGVYSWNRDE
ncbi:uncharacterized protein BXZ73DRAFT_50943 [Epithele typhae]|uniref:uncharacterized protein n=1 Tax=Epithele typhae TaxID=378194 RepID=UPI0020073791|nr:uncharacterized protein BXZ73DRAFT_50943 [Epithele typhae]KAH9923478.1 hypothetical protein BXZ73DRAFT_50943 [Epithele typhae]